MTDLTEAMTKREVCDLLEKSVSAYVNSGCAEAQAHNAHEAAVAFFKAECLLAFIDNVQEWKR